jgi:hypothetical protein
VRCSVPQASGFQRTDSAPVELNFSKREKSTAAMTEFQTRGDKKTQAVLAHGLGKVGPPGFEPGTKGL